MSTRIVRRLAICRPAPVEVILVAAAYVAATLMSGILLRGRLGATLGDINAIGASCGFVASLLFTVRMRVMRTALDAGSDRRMHHVCAGALLVPEAALLVAVGRLTVLTWLLATIVTVVVHVAALLGLERRCAAYLIARMAAAGIAFSTLLAIGIDTRDGDLSVIDLLSSRHALGTVLAATSIVIGIEWGREFDRLESIHGEWGWSLWLLWPSAGALGFTALVRATYPTWSLVALVVVCLVTIFGHALVMGQRVRPGTEQPAQHRPSGALRELTSALPVASALLVFLVLAAAGVWEYVT
jgi:hypothetical protein